MKKLLIVLIILAWTVSPAAARTRCNPAKYALFRSASGHNEVRITWACNAKRKHGSETINTKKICGVTYNDKVVCGNGFKYLRPTNGSTSIIKLRSSKYPIKRIFVEH